MEIIVDTREKYAWKFTAPQATASKEALPVGDYGVKLCGEWIAVVERIDGLRQQPDQRQTGVRSRGPGARPPSVVADMLAECPGSTPKGAHPVRRNSGLGPGVSPPILRRRHSGTTTSRRKRHPLVGTWGASRGGGFKDRVKGLLEDSGAAIISV